MGLPSRTASVAPAGTKAGAGPYCISSGVKAFFRGWLGFAAGLLIACGEALCMASCPTAIQVITRTNATAYFFMGLSFRTDGLSPRRVVCVSANCTTIGGAACDSYDFGRRRVAAL